MLKLHDFPSGFIILLLWQDEKVPYAARNIFFVIANAGCLFLAGGIFLENLFLIKSGVFVLLIHALVDAHFIICRYFQIKSFKEKEKENAKK